MDEKGKSQLKKKQNQNNMIAKDVPNTPIKHLAILSKFMFVKKINNHDEVLQQKVSETVKSQLKKTQNQNNWIAKDVPNTQQTPCNAFWVHVCQKDQQP